MENYYDISQYPQRYSDLISVELPSDEKTVNIVEKNLRGYLRVSTVDLQNGAEISSNVEFSNKTLPLYQQR